MINLSVPVFSAASIAIGKTSAAAALFVTTLLIIKVAKYTAGGIANFLVKIGEAVGIGGKPIYRICRFPNQLLGLIALCFATLRCWFVGSSIFCDLYDK